MKKLNIEQIELIGGNDVVDGFCGTVIGATNIVLRIPGVATAIGPWGWLAIGVANVSCGVYYATKK